MLSFEKKKESKNVYMNNFIVKSLSVFFGVGLVFSLTPNIAVADDLDDNCKMYEQQLNDAKTEKKNAEIKQSTIESTLASLQESFNKNAENLANCQKRVETLIKAKEGFNSDINQNLLKMALYSELYSTYTKDLFSNDSILSEQVSVLSNLTRTNNTLSSQLADISETKESLINTIIEKDSFIADVQAQYEETLKAIEERDADAQLFNLLNLDLSTIEGVLTVNQFRFQGVIDLYGFHYTYYEQSVLPGGGLTIPGRHIDQGCVVDEDNYIVVASDNLPKGTLVPTPLKEHPIGRVYDDGVHNPIGLDLYIM